MKKEEVELGMVFKFSTSSEIEYVVIGLYPDDVSLERINHRTSGNNRHALGYGWFVNEFSTFIRKMNGKELQQYQTNDPLCDLETGIYKLRKDIVDIDFKTLADEGEIIDVSRINCEESSFGNHFRLEVTFNRFGYVDDTTVTFYKDTKMECIHFFWRVMKKINTNI